MRQYIIASKDKTGNNVYSFDINLKEEIQKGVYQINHCRIPHATASLGVYLRFNNSVFNNVRKIASNKGEDLFIPYDIEEKAFIIRPSDKAFLYLKSIKTLNIEIHNVATDALFDALSDEWIMQLKFIKEIPEFIA